MNPLDLIEKLINEHGSSLILKERLLLIKDELEKSEKENRDLQDQIENLKNENISLKEQIKKLTKEKEFIEHKGVLFKAKKSGGYHEIPYCPICKLSMFSMEGFFPYQCSKCGFASSFKSNEIQTVLEEIKSKDI